MVNSIETLMKRRLRSEAKSITITRKQYLLNMF